MHWNIYHSAREVYKWHKLSGRTALAEWMKRERWLIWIRIQQANKLIHTNAAGVINGMCVCVERASKRSALSSPLVIKPLPKRGQQLELSALAQAANFRGIQSRVISLYVCVGECSADAHTYLATLQVLAQAQPSSRPAAHSFEALHTKRELRLERPDRRLLDLPPSPDQCRSPSLSSSRASNFRC